MAEVGPMSEFIVPEGVRDRIETLTARRRDVWIVAVFLAVAVAGGLLLWSRGGAPAVAPPAVEPKSKAASAGVPQSDAASGAPATLYVHVAGAVRRPGLYQLPGGSRVADALEAARGALPRADLDLINLAEAVTDGVQVYVPRRGEGTAAAEPSSSSSPESDSAVVDINKADQTALETIPGIGPVKATAILEYRESAGGFESVEELLEVTGIGPATLESMRAHVTAG
jgi:competence protein ComEA